MTELDIANAPPEEYVEVVTACLDIESCVGVTVWGISDKVRFPSLPFPFLLSLLQLPPSLYSFLSRVHADEVGVTCRTRGGRGRTRCCSTPSSSLSRRTMRSSRRCALTTASYEFSVPFDAFSFVFAAPLHPSHV